MPSSGVVRPYTLVDVLGTINDQTQQALQGATTVNGVGFFGEADETATAADTAATYVTTPQGWDQGYPWGALDGRNARP